MVEIVPPTKKRAKGAFLGVQFQVEERPGNHANIDIIVSFGYARLSKRIGNKTNSYIICTKAEIKLEAKDGDFSDYTPSSSVSKKVETETTYSNTKGFSVHGFEAGEAESKKKKTTQMQRDYELTVSKDHNQLTWVHRNSNEKDASQRYPYDLKIFANGYSSHLPLPTFICELAPLNRIFVDEHGNLLDTIQSLALMIKLKSSGIPLQSITPIKHEIAING